MSPAPRPPSPSQRLATQMASRRDNPNQLTARDASILVHPSSFLTGNGPSLTSSTLLDHRWDCRTARRTGESPASQIRSEPPLPSLLDPLETSAGAPLGPRKRPLDVPAARDLSVRSATGDL